MLSALNQQGLYYCLDFKQLFHRFLQRLTLMVHHIFKEKMGNFITTGQVKVQFL